MTLYELSDAYAAFMAALEAGEIPEETVADTLEGLTSSIEEKVDNIACLIKNLEANAGAIKEEAKALAARADAKKKHADRLRQYLADMLPRSGYERRAFETTRNRLSWRKSEAVVFDDEAAFVQWAKSNDPELLNWKEPEPSKSLIKDSIKSGIDVPGARLEERNNLQIK